jgi:hypothetical protein
MLILLVCVALVASLAMRAMLSGSHDAAKAGGVSAGLLATAAVEAVERRARTVAPDGPPRGAERRPAKVPTAAAMRAAWRFARRRAGVVSVAVVDSEGKLRGRRESRRYPAASVVKAMLLAAEVRRLKRAGEPMDSTTDSLLTAMITESDNDAADAIYARVGDAGLVKVARRMRMKRFTVAGYWGNAQITAADMARLFGDLDRAFARRYREYAKGLLGSVVASQSWGIPAAAGERWAVRFKGGWLPDRALVHQAAELREQGAKRMLSIVVLTDHGPSFEYGVKTIREVASRLLKRPRGHASGARSESRHHRAPTAAPTRRRAPTALSSPRRAPRAPRLRR